MANTTIRGQQIKDGDVTRADLNTATSGSAVIRKIVAGTNVSLTSTGADAGTGDVTIDVSTPSPTYAISTKTALYTETATSGEIILLCNTSGGTFTITLATAVSNTSKVTIKKIAGSSVVTIDANGTQTIDGGLTATLNRIYESITLVSDGSNWQII